MIPKFLLLSPFIFWIVQTCEPDDHRIIEPNESRTTTNIETGMVVKLTYMLGSSDKDSEVKEISRNAQSIYHESDLLVKHIDRIIAKTYSVLLYGADSKIREEVYSNGKFNIRLDRLRSIADINDREVISKLMLGNLDHLHSLNNSDGYNYSAVELHRRLGEFQDRLIENLSVVDGGEEFIKTILNKDCFELDGTDEKLTRKNWSVKYFAQVPLVACSSKLITLQSQVLNLASEFVEESYRTVKRIEDERGVK